MNWDNDKVEGYADRTIWVQFRPAGSSTYTTVKKVTSKDRWRGCPPPCQRSRTATWRLYYNGNSVSGNSGSSGDTVDVK